MTHAIAPFGGSRWFSVDAKNFHEFFNHLTHFPVTQKLTINHSLQAAKDPALQPNMNPQNDPLAAFQNDIG